MGAVKAQQFGNLLLVAEVFSKPLFQDRTESRIKLAVLSSQGLVLIAGPIHCHILAGQILEHGQNATRIAFTDGLDVLAFLEQLSRHIQGQIGRVHHPFDKAQINGHQTLGVIHDEHPFDIKFKACSLVAIEQIKGGFGRNVEKLCVLGAAFHSVVAPRQGVFKVTGNGFVELFVFLCGDVFFSTRPQGIGFVDRFKFGGRDHLTGLILLALFPLLFEHQNGQRDVV